MTRCVKIGIAQKKRGVAISRDAPFYLPIGLFCLTKPGMFRARTTVELLPAIQRRRKFHSALDSLRQSIKAAAVEVKRKNFCVNAIYEIAAPHKTPRAKKLMQSALVITLARGYVQVRAAHAHFDAMKILAAIRVLRLERDGVLIARLFGDGGVQIFQSAILAGVKSIAAGGGGISLEARALLLAKRVAHGNGINGNIGLQQEL